MGAFWPTSGILLLIVVLSTLAAPVYEDGSQELQTHDTYQDSRGCYYNFEHYEEGDRIVTNEPCLNCTCHNHMLMCYLRVCPFTKAIGQDCTVEKRPDQCCPIITCPQVPVQLLTSSTTLPPTTTTAIGRPDSYGCMLDNNTFYPDGAQVPSDQKKPCELCYCIRNRTACVIQECTLNVEGCRPVHQEGVCCPVRYDCDYEEVLTTPRPTVGLVTTPGGPTECQHNGQVYNDGEMVPVSEKAPCEHCYCMRGDIVCAVQDCGTPLEGVDCSPVPPPPGQCCPSTFNCANGTVPIEPLTDDHVKKPEQDGHHDQGHKAFDDVVKEDSDEESSEEKLEPVKDITEAVEVTEQSLVSDTHSTMHYETVTASFLADHHEILHDVDTTSSESIHEIAPSTISPVDQEDPMQTTQNSLEGLESHSQVSQESVSDPEEDSALEHNGDSSLSPSSPPATYTEISVENVEMHTSAPTYHPTNKENSELEEGHTNSEEQEATSQMPHEPDTIVHSVDDVSKPEIEPEVTPDIPQETTVKQIDKDEAVEPSKIPQPVDVSNEIPEITSGVGVTTVSPTQGPPGVDQAAEVPGEGSCLVDGNTYSHDAEIPTTNPCQSSCRCISSIVHCKYTDCPPAPHDIKNCMPVQVPNVCCPTYHCDENPANSLDSDSHRLDEVKPDMEDNVNELIQHEEVGAPQHTEVNLEQSSTNIVDDKDIHSDSHTVEPIQANNDITQSEGLTGLQESSSTSDVQSALPHETENVGYPEHDSENGKVVADNEDSVESSQSPDNSETVTHSITESSSSSLPQSVHQVLTEDSNIQMSTLHPEVIRDTEETPQSGIDIVSSHGDNEISLHEHSQHEIPTAQTDSVSDDHELTVTEVLSEESSTIGHWGSDSITSQDSVTTPEKETISSNSKPTISEHVTDTDGVESVESTTVNNQDSGIIFSHEHTESSHEPDNVSEFEILPSDSTTLPSDLHDEIEETLHHDPSLASSSEEQSETLHSEHKDSIPSEDTGEAHSVSQQGEYEETSGGISPSVVVAHESEETHDESAPGSTLSFHDHTQSDPDKFYTTTQASEQSVENESSVEASKEDEGISSSDSEKVKDQEQPEHATEIIDLKEPLHILAEEDNQVTTFGHPGGLIIANQIRETSMKPDHFENPDTTTLAPELPSPTGSSSHSEETETTDKGEGQTDNIVMTDGKKDDTFIDEALIIPVEHDDQPQHHESEETHDISATDESVVSKDQSVPTPEDTSSWSPHPVPTEEPLLPHETEHSGLESSSDFPVHKDKEHKGEDEAQTQEASESEQNSVHHDSLETHVEESTTEDERETSSKEPLPSHQDSEFVQTVQGGFEHQSSEDDVTEQGITHEDVTHIPDNFQTSEGPTDKPTNSISNEVSQNNEQHVLHEENETIHADVSSSEDQEHDESLSDHEGSPFDASIIPSSPEDPSAPHTEAYLPEESSTLGGESSSIESLDQNEEHLPSHINHSDLHELGHPTTEDITVVPEVTTIVQKASDEVESSESDIELHQENSSPTDTYEYATSTSKAVMVEDVLVEHPKEIVSSEQPPISVGELNHQEEIHKDSSLEHQNVEHIETESPTDKPILEDSATTQKEEEEQEKLDEVSHGVDFSQTSGDLNTWTESIMENQPNPDVDSLQTTLLVTNPPVDDPTTPSEQHDDHTESLITAEGPSHIESEESHNSPEKTTVIDNATEINKENEIHDSVISEGIISDAHQESHPNSEEIPTESPQETISHSPVETVQEVQDHDSGTILTTTNEKPNEEDSTVPHVESPLHISEEESILQLPEGSIVESVHLPSAPVIPILDHHTESTSLHETSTLEPSSTAHVDQTYTAGAEEASTETEEKEPDVTKDEDLIGETGSETSSLDNVPQSHFSDSGDLGSQVLLDKDVESGITEEQHSAHEETVSIHDETQTEIVSVHEEDGSHKDTSLDVESSDVNNAPEISQDSETPSPTDDSNNVEVVPIHEDDNSVQQSVSETESVVHHTEESLSAETTYEPHEEHGTTHDILASEVDHQTTVQTPVMDDIHKDSLPFVDNADQVTSHTETSHEETQEHLVPTEISYLPEHNVEISGNEDSKKDEVESPDTESLIPQSQIHEGQHLGPAEPESSEPEIVTEITTEEVHSHLEDHSAGQINESSDIEKDNIITTTEKNEIETVTIAHEHITSEQTSNNEQEIPSSEGEVTTEQGIAMTSVAGQIALDSDEQHQIPELDVEKEHIPSIADDVSQHQIPELDVEKEHIPSIADDVSQHQIPEVDVEKEHIPSIADDVSQHQIPEVDVEKEHIPSIADDVSQHQIPEVDVEKEHIPSIADDVSQHQIPELDVEKEHIPSMADDVSQHQIPELDVEKEHIPSMADDVSQHKLPELDVEKEHIPSMADDVSQHQIPELDVEKEHIPSMVDDVSQHQIPELDVEKEHIPSIADDVSQHQIPELDVEKEHIPSMVDDVSEHANQELEFNNSGILHVGSTSVLPESHAYVTEQPYDTEGHETTDRVSLNKQNTTDDSKGTDIAHVEPEHPGAPTTTAVPSQETVTTILNESSHPTEDHLVETSGKPMTETHEYDHVSSEQPHEIQPTTEGYTQSEHSSEYSHIATEVPQTEKPTFSHHGQTHLGSPLFPDWSQKPHENKVTTEEPQIPEDFQYPSGPEQDYDDDENGHYGPGTCRYGGKVYLSAQQIPRDDPCDFCFCFRSDIICLQQSCPPPIQGCYQEKIHGFCCPRYECHVSMATMLNLTTTTTTTTTTLPPHFFPHAYSGAAMRGGCQVKGRTYRVGDRITSTSGPCLDCRCGANGRMKCDPTICGPQEALIRQVMDAAAVSRR